MPNTLTIIRSLIIYSLCLPLAVWLGYLLAVPMNSASLGVIILALALPLVPVMLRWHHFLLIASWNFTAMLFFIPGRPNVWILIALISLVLSVLQRILSRETKLLSVPSVTRPLVFLLLVILITAQLTGGIGIRTFGGEAYGGKRYVLTLAAIIGYFAISCRGVPRGREVFYVSMFLLGSISWVISSLGGIIDPSLNFIFLFFPVENLQGLSSGEEQVMYTRLGGLSLGMAAVVWYGLARYGLRGLFRLSEPWHFLPLRIGGGLQMNQPWRMIFVLLAVWFSLYGGYRGAAIFFAMMFLCHFYLEGLHRSRALLAVIMISILSVLMGLPMVSKLPPMVQRAISFLPLEIDPVVRMSAETSSEWRLNIWRLVWPEVPKYLLLGKGYSINPMELAMVQGPRAGDGIAAMILSGDYHNGPLTLLIPLGIWGALGFLWFVVASLRVLHRNYRYGDPELRHVNTFLLAYFFVQTVAFFTIFGSFHHMLCTFTGVIALSISINGGRRGPVPVVAAQPAFHQFRLARAARSTPVVG